MGRMVIEELYMPQLDRKRKIRIYLPTNYDNTEICYPVIYMHDGQNLFDDSISFGGVSWGIKDTMERLENENKTEGIIVVGIDNGDDMRVPEYSPFVSKEFLEHPFVKERETFNCEGMAYAQFITDTLKPYIDNKYRTLNDRNNTAIAGSSCGANISLYVGMRYPEVFSKIGAFSPAIWIMKEELIEFIKKSNVIKDTQVYVDIGTREIEEEEKRERPVIDARDIFNAFNDLGIDSQNLSFIIDEGAKHNEEAWANRFPQFISWIFNLRSM